MRIVVDLNRCQTYAQCCFLAPDVFQIRGEEILIYKPEPSEDQRLRVLRAQAACPVGAIAIEDQQSLEPLQNDSSGAPLCNV